MRITASPSLAFVALAHAPCRCFQPGPVLAAPFESLEIRLERNVTDGDAEMVLEAVSGDCGLTSFRVRAPGGAIVAQLYSGPPTLGTREVLVESPEPSVAEVRAAYPAGVYRFSGQTFCGETLNGTASLQHAFPPPSEIVSPEPDAEDVPLHDVILEWSAVAGASAYRIELEQEDLGISWVLDVPAETTDIEIPESLLVAGHEYEVGVGVIAANRNISFVESTFTTVD